MTLGRDGETPVIDLSEILRLDREGIDPVELTLTLPRHLVEALSALAKRLPEQRGDDLSAAARIVLLAGHRVLRDVGEAAGVDVFEKR